jgi:hypothetical protein
MSVVVDTFAAPWAPDGSGLWTVASTSAAARYGADGLGMEISSAAGAAAAPAPSAEKHFGVPLDLRDQSELRFWLRSSRPGDGSPAQPVYLRVEATTDPPGGPPWQRLVPVARADAWQLVVLWLGDMPPALRQAVGFLRLESLDGRIAFRAAVDDLIATTPAPVTNADAALAERLDGRWSVEVGGVPTPVPAVLDLPEGPAPPAAPYILVTPWSVRSPGTPGGELDVVDNPTAAGAFVRPSPSLVELVYRIDVWAQSRAQKSFLLDRIVADLLEPVVIDDVAYRAEPYTPADTERAALVPPGRTPLFVRLLLPVETGVRVFRPLAVPLVLVGDSSDHSDAEATSP